MPPLDRADTAAGYEPEMVERGLWEVAICGGKTNRAAKQLEEWAFATANPGQPPVATPSGRTLHHWITGRHRDRYTEIRSGRARELEEHIASEAIESAIELSDLQREATLRTYAGLQQATGVEASLILRNVSQVKATALEDAGKIRGRSGFVQDHRSLEQLAAVLIARGAAHAVDTTAVEEPPAAELAP